MILAYVLISLCVCVCAYGMFVLFPVYQRKQNERILSICALQRSKAKKTVFFSVKYSLSFIVVVVIALCASSY